MQHDDSGGRPKGPDAPKTPHTLIPKHERAMRLAAKAFGIPLHRVSTGELEINFDLVADSYPPPLLIVMTAPLMRHYMDEHRQEMVACELRPEGWLAIKSIERDWRMYAETYVPDSTMSRVVMRALLDGMADKDELMIGVMSSAACYAVAADGLPDEGIQLQEKKVIDFLSAVLFRIRSVEQRRRA